MIRKLNSKEIECRVQTMKENGCSILLYKDARCDMRILDEVFGVDGWQRSHEVINNNLFCTVKIWSEKTNTWVSKQDVGTESMTEKEKGQASDSFKRACFNIGIGRELYTAPFIWINLASTEVYEKNGKFYTCAGVKFFVKEIEYDKDGNISKLTIADNKKVERYKYNENALKELKTPEAEYKEQENNEKILKGVISKISKCKTVTEIIEIYNNLSEEMKVAVKPHATSKKLEIEKQ